MTSPSMAIQNLSMMPTFGSSWQLPVSMGWCSTPRKQFKAQMVKFFQCLFDESGDHPDPEKALPTQTNATELQEFLGMVIYLSPFIPGLSILTAPLHELLKKDAEFNWDPPTKQPFNVLRMLLLVTLLSSTVMPLTQ